jgi:hypothetical protein
MVVGSKLNVPVNGVALPATSLSVIFKPEFAFSSVVAKLKKSLFKAIM